MTASTPAHGLSQISLFEGLDETHLTALAAMADSLTVARGDFLVQESERGNELFAILGGRVSITIQMPERIESETLAELKDGDTLGESVLLGRQRRIASACAHSEVKAMRWSGDKLVAYLEKHPDCGYRVMRNLAAIMLTRLTSTNMMLRNTANRIVPII